MNRKDKEKTKDILFDVSRILFGYGSYFFLWGSLGDNKDTQNDSIDRQIHVTRGTGTPFLDLVSTSCVRYY